MPSTPIKIRMEMTGTKSMLRNMDRWSSRKMNRVRDALFEQGIAIFNLSQQRVPVLTGSLRATGFVEPPRKMRLPNLGFLVIIRYRSGYAFAQHEIPYAHRHGQWKYLSSAVIDRKPKMVAAMADAVRGR